MLTIDQETIVTSLLLAIAVIAMTATEEVTIKAGDPMVGEVMAVDEEVPSGASSRKDGIKLKLMKLITLTYLNIQNISIVVSIFTRDRESSKTGMVAHQMLPPPPASVSLSELSSTTSTMSDTLAAQTTRLTDIDRDCQNVRGNTRNDTTSDDPNRNLTPAGGTPGRSERAPSGRS